MADPRALKPGDLVRLLNSTPLGEVIDARTLRRHRELGGVAVGDRHSVNLVRYVAWLAKRSAAPKPEREVSDPEAAYTKHREKMAQRMREQAETARDIGECPAVKDPARKEACRFDLRAFALTYFPAVFSRPFGPDHEKAIATLQRCILQGGQFALAMPRGHGKTALCIVAALWALLYGHRRFVVLIGAAAKPHAIRLAESISAHIETNRGLGEDFPEVCFPIRSLQGIAGRAPGQLCRGLHGSGGKPAPTNITWSGTEIVLPTIAGSAASSAAIYTAGLTASIRGQQFVRPDGAQARPDLVIVDDPQTDESAMSVAQCAARLRIIRAGVLGLAGPGETIAAVMPCTVIRAGDVADELLDRKKHPIWNGQRTKLVHSFPTNEKLWERYAVLWSEGRSEDGGHDTTAATEFYRAHREAMDAGAVVSWEHRKRAHELSAIQHAMNLRLENEQAFWSEYQSEPQAEDEASDLGQLTAEQIAERLSRVPRRTLPLGTTHLTAMIDVQQDLLFYVVSAWSTGFTGSVVDYDAFPEQPVEHYTLRNARRRLAHLFPGAGIEGALLAGLEQLTAKLLAAEWLTEDGTPLRISRMLIDANWPVSTPIVDQVCRLSPHAAQLMPSHGTAVSATKRPLEEWTKKQGDQIGTHWRITGSKGRRQVRPVIYDTNFWKTFVHSRMAVALGDPSALSLFGTKSTRHRLFAEHLTAEKPSRIKGPTRLVDVWEKRPGRDNHWFDALVGSAVAASMLGVSLPNMERKQRKPKRRITLSELQAQRRGRTV